MTGFLFFLLLIPLVMAAGGYHLQHHPTNINLLYGYRTTMSTRNADTWAFAQQHCGKIWFRVGMIMLPLSIAVLLIAMAQSLETGLYIELGALAVQTIVLLACCVPTELALRRTFDRKGSRIAK